MIRLSVSGVTLFLARAEYIQTMIFMSIALILVTLVAWSTAGEDWGC